MGVTWITKTNITPVTTGAWTDIDVSSYIPSGSTGVILHVYDSNNTANTVGFRNNGSTDDRKEDFGAYNQRSVFIGIDNNRIFEGYFQRVLNFSVYLVGYFDSDIIFNINGTDITVAGTGSWLDKDINVGDSATGAIIEVYNSSISALSYGLRKNSSTDNIYGTTQPKKIVSTIIGVDESEIFEGKVSSSGIYFYLIGYVKSGITFNTNATDLSLSTTGAFYDIALPSGATGGFIEVINTSSSGYSYALRENGSSENIYRGLKSPVWYAVECDDSQLIEGKIANISVDFYLIAYAGISTNPYTNVYIYNGSSWVNPSAVKYYDGLSWVDITAINRSDGATWVTV